MEIKQENEPFYEFNELNLKKNIDINKLKYQMEKIYKEFSLINEGNINIINHKDDYSLIAKMIYINNKLFGYLPRKIQIISILNFINKEKSMGLIQQINTGEGKSLIISFLAVYISLKENKKVDILTSSSILAERDALFYKKFYESFNLNVSYNSNHNDESQTKDDLISNKKKNYLCYEADIVYGDILSFSGDLLRTEYLKTKGRGEKRKYDCIIIDEIDNIALDNLKQTTELLDSFHGYKLLEYIYLFIYKKLIEIKKDYDKNNYINKKDEIIKRLSEISNKEFQSINTLNEKNIFIPLHLEKFIKNKLENWVESAFIAEFLYHKNENYIIRYNKEFNINVINPIDFYNTGNTLENSVWIGLHQFLQIKEGVMLTEENLNTCYISNFSFFNKYTRRDDSNKKIIENKIYGLTGTVGSNYNINSLKELYNLNVLIIPPFRKPQFIKENPCIILIKNKEKEKESNQIKKYINIKSLLESKLEEKIIDLMKKERSILVIFKYINDVEKIYNKLKDREEIKKIIKYSRSDLKEENNFLKEDIKPQTLILSTNIAGRGTDITISPELEKKGGLHVILTYEPFNERIEKQAFGRAGRKGQKGSGGKIMISTFTEKEIIEERNKREKEEYNFLLSVYRYKIEVFERIFEKFTKFLEKIEKETNEEIILMDIKERWGHFLVENNLDKLEKKYKEEKSKVDSGMFISLEQRYDDFEKQLNNYNYGKKNNDKKNYEIMNPLYLNKSKELKHINEAIKRSPHLSLRSYMFRIIENVNKIKDNNSNNINTKTEFNDLRGNIINDFNSLTSKLEALIRQFKIYERLIKELVEELGFSENSELFIQNNQKIEIVEFILKIMKNNLKEFNKYIQNTASYKLNIKKFSLKYILEKKRKNKNYNLLIIEYFKELGLSLFSINAIPIKNKNNNNNCQIF
jgi:hypothetical protein